MDLTVFEYITEIPDLITNELWYELAVKSYNLGLTFFWFFILSWIFNLVFTCFNKHYKRGAS